MSDLHVELDQPYDAMLHSFKPVVESVIEEELDFDAYVNVVIWRGLKAMMADVVPYDADTLMRSFLLMYEANPAFVASFMTAMLQAGSPPDEVKERLGFIKDR